MRLLLLDGRASVDHGAGIWFREPVREMTIFAEHHDFALSLLILDDSAPYISFDEPVEFEWVVVARLVQAVELILFSSFLVADGLGRCSVRGAGIERDKQRRQGCAMTKAKQQVLCVTRRAIDSAARGTHRG